MTDQTEAGTLPMPLSWIKSNWTILSALGLMTWGGYSYIDTIRETQKMQGRDLVEIRQQMDQRAIVADKRYEESVADAKAENLPNRVKMLEQQQTEFRDLFRQFQAGQVAQFEALRDGFADIKTEVRVVSSKVDDLRSETPRKTNFIVK